MSHGVDCFQIGNDDSVIGGIRVVGVDPRSRTLNGGLLYRCDMDLNIGNSENVPVVQRFFLPPRISCQVNANIQSSHAIQGKCVRVTYFTLKGPESIIT